MAVTHETDHAGVAQATLPAQFRDSTTLLALVGAVVGSSLPSPWGLQDIEDVLIQLRDNRWLDSATGKQLDGLGELLGLHRVSANDDEYRAALYVQVAINCSQGEPERLIDLVVQITGGNAHLLEKKPARVKITAMSATATYGLTRLHKAVSAGVALDVQSTPGNHPFIYGRARDAAGVQTTITKQHPYGLGYGVPGSPGTGGVYAALYYATT